MIGLISSSLSKTMVWKLQLKLRSSNMRDVDAFSFISLFWPWRFFSVFCNWHAGACSQKVHACRGIESGDKCQKIPFEKKKCHSSLFSLANYSVFLHQGEAFLCLPCPSTGITLWPPGAPSFSWRWPSWSEHSVAADNTWPPRRASCRWPITAPPSASSILTGHPVWLLLGWNLSWQWDWTAGIDTAPSVERKPFGSTMFLTKEGSTSVCDVCRSGFFVFLFVLFVCDMAKLMEHPWMHVQIFFFVSSCNYDIQWHRHCCSWTAEWKFGRECCCYPLLI